MSQHTIIFTIIALFAIFDISAKKKKEYPRAADHDNAFLKAQYEQWSVSGKDTDKPSQ